MRMLVVDERSYLAEAIFRGGDTVFDWRPIVTPGPFTRDAIRSAAASKCVIL